ncbi:MAG: SAM-dependent methyltransferase [Bryobacteraceae bacterium]
MRSTTFTLIPLANSRSWTGRMPGERFFDIGCGWGGLIIWAAEHYGVVAHGCTLSAQQLQFADTLIKNRSLQNRVSVELCNLSSCERDIRQNRIGRNV